MVEKNWPSLKSIHILNLCVLESNTVLIKGGDRWFRIPNQQENSWYGQQGSPQGGGNNRTSQNYQHQRHAPPVQGENRGQTPVNSPRGRDAFQPGTDRIPSYQSNYNQEVQRVRPLGDQSSYAPPGQGEYRGNDRTYGYGHGPSSGTHGHGLSGFQSPETGGSYGQGPNGGFYGQGPSGGFYGQGLSGGFYGQGLSGGFCGQGPSGGFYRQGQDAGGYWQGHSHGHGLTGLQGPGTCGFYGHGQGPSGGFYGQGPSGGFYGQGLSGGFTGKDRVVDLRARTECRGLRARTHS
uniref:keratin, type I cytoskeletal 9-like n=1 Tax=Fragaria vesca subsp. vesca TaxID=101020 RepID=UPI0005CABF29|nr:PREDICTED: keratin, type I cytoskeletal 9-like [Fragaria vesca subsp. vesca]